MCGSALTGLGSADGLVSRVVGMVPVVVGAPVVVSHAATSSTSATPPNHLITRPSSRTVDWSIGIGAEGRRGPLPIWSLNPESVAAVEGRRPRSCRGRDFEKDFGQIRSLADLPRPKSPRPGIKPGRGRGFQNDFGQIRSLADLPRPKSLPDPGAQPGAGVSRRTSDGSGHWPTPHVQSPAPTQARGAKVSRTTSDGSGHWPTSRVQSPRPHPVAQATRPRVGTRRTARRLSRRGRSLVNLARKGSDSALKPTQCSPCQWGEFW
jgi:hypothetical protein